MLTREVRREEWGEIMEERRKTSGVRKNKSKHTNCPKVTPKDVLK